MSAQHTFGEVPALQEGRAAQEVRAVREARAPREAQALDRAQPLHEARALRKAQGLRSRPVPQAECLMVFSPHSGRIHWLGLDTWLLLELCDGRSAEAVARGYTELAGDKLGGDARARALRGLESLLGSRLIEAV